jgi:putative ABC transport system permease protein
MLHDLRYALRGLRRNSGFAVAAILTLALGIGAATSIFSVADAVLIRPLPYPKQDRLVMVWNQLLKLGQTQFPVNYRTYVPYSQSGVFESCGVFRLETATLTGAGDAARLMVLQASAGLLPLLGATPGIGRGFNESENKPGHAKTAILSHAFFVNRFGGNRDVMGRAITLDGKPYMVIGVMPADFEFNRIAEPPDVWTPIALADDGQWGGGLEMIARLRPGVSTRMAQAALDVVAKHIDETLRPYRGPNGEDPEYRVKVVSLHDQLLGEFRTATMLLLAAVGAVLLIALANVSNLLLVRAVSREREFAVRRAMGASEARLARQWIAEAAVLVGIGGILGAIASVWCVRVLVALSPAALPAVTRVSVDGRALAVTLGLGAMVSILFGLAPLGAGRSNLRGAASKKRTASVLIAAEVALAVVLLIGATLLLQSFASLRHVDAGFRPEHLLTMHLDLPHERYPEAQDRIAFYSALRDRLAAIPGVTGVGQVSRLPVNGSSVNSRGGNPFSIEGRPWNPNSAVPQLAHTQAADPDYFRTMRIPLLAGRVFADTDTASSGHVAVVNETLARGFFPQGAIGEHIMLGAPRSGYPWLTIVGVVGDVKTAGLDEAAIPQFYQPLTQDASPWIAIALLTAGDPKALTRAATAAIHAIDPERPVYQLETMEQRITETISQPRFEALVVGAFAFAALFLAAIGIFGVVAHSTAQRTREIGIRIALGADAGRVVRHVMLTGLRPVLAGMVIGIGGTLAAGKILGSVLFRVKANDPATFAIAVCVLGLVAVAACLGPARKAARIDPAAALGSE